MPTKSKIHSKDGGGHNRRCNASYPLAHSRNGIALYKPDPYGTFLFKLTNPSYSKTNREIRAQVRTYQRRQAIANIIGNRTYNEINSNRIDHSYHSYPSNSSHQPVEQVRNCNSVRSIGQDFHPVYVERPGLLNTTNDLTNSIGLIEEPSYKRHLGSVNLLESTTNAFVTPVEVGGCGFRFADGSRRDERSGTTSTNGWNWNSFIPSFVRNSAHLNNLISLLKTDVLNMGKIQDLKNKVGAEQLKMPQKEIWRCLGAEFLGTAILVFIGCGSGITLKEGTPTGLTGCALCWGLTVATLAQTIGHVSGCHINPSITLAMLVTGKIQLVKAALYVIVQCLGGIVGIAVLKALTPENIDENYGYGMTSIHKDLTFYQGFGIEFLSTFILAMVVFGLGDENRNDIKGSGPLAVGFTVASVIIFSGPFTGASLNPARSLGPSVITGKWEYHWVYWLAPIGGAVTAGALYQSLFRQLRPEELEETRTRGVEAKENGTIPPV